MVRKMAKKHALSHPTSPHTCVAYGWTTTLGFHATLLVRCDPSKQVRGPFLADVLTALAGWNFFEEHTPQLAMQQLSFLMPEEMEDPEIARCARVIVDLRRAAD